MDRFRKFMYGRYGLDQFSQMLIISAIILSLLGTIVRSSILLFICYIPFVYAIYRILSKNVNKRIQENYKYMGITSSVRDRFHKRKLTMTGTKTHKYYHCPKCRQTIRVPRGKGKICITCPKCKTDFIKRT